MAVASRSLTLVQFLELPEEKPALEFLDGEVTQKVSPKGRHGILQYALAERINQSGQPRKLARAIPELRCTFAGSSVVPDLAVYRWNRIPEDDRGRAADDFVEPPEIAIEIVSPGQSVNELNRRSLGYVAHGVQLALLVDPDDESILAFRPEQLPVAWQGQDLIDLRWLLPEFEFAVQDLFAALDQR